MDTNANEFKGSKANRILCIILCIITFLSSIGLGTLGILAQTYKSYNLDEYQLEISADYKETYLFKNWLLMDLEDVLNCVNTDVVQMLAKNEIIDQKDEIVNEAYEAYSKQEPHIKQSIDYGEYYYYDGEEYHNNGEGYNEYEEYIDYYVYSSDNTSYKFVLNCVDIYIKSTENDVDPRYLIAESYDKWAEEQIDDTFYDYYNRSRYEDTLRIYVNYNDETYGNASLVRDEVTKNSSTYYIYENGKVDYRGINDVTATSLTEMVNGFESISKDICIIVQFLPMPSVLGSIINARYWNDYYASISSFCDMAFAVGRFVPLLIIGAVILLAVSFVLAFRLFRASNKATFIDKIPVDIHFVLTVLLGFLWCIPWTFVQDRMPTEYSPVFCISFAVGLTVLQVLMLEFCSSVARIKNSGKDLEDCFVTEMIVRKSKQSVIKLIEYLSYKPKAMERNAIILTVLYFVLNAIMLGIIICMWLTFEFWIIVGIFLFVIDIAVNILIVVKVIGYLKKLDEIITSFSSKEDLTVEIDKLPNSLKMLAESMKYTNDGLQQAVEKAVKDERLRSELITNVSHDLKTPLTSIITYVDLLSKCDIDDEKAKDYIKVLDEKGAKLKRLIEDLIEASKVTSGNVNVNLTSINLTELSLQSTVDAQSEFEKADLQLIVKSCEKPPIVNADGAKTFRIIENLLSNARKYSARSTRVYVDVYEDNGYGVFEIKNISAEPLDISPNELTERFVRGDKSRTKEGNGLGLSIAKELCRLQHGILEIVIDGDLFKAKVKLPLIK